MDRPESAIEDLLRDLDNPDRPARCRAVRGLGEARDPRAVEPLLRMLADRAGDVRPGAAVALGKLRDPRAIGPLIEATRDAKVSVRSGAIAALKKFGKRAYQPLIEAYRAADGGPRLAFLEALGRHKTPEVSELLIAALDDPDPALPLAATRLLGRRKDRRAVDRLVETLAELGPALGRAPGQFERRDAATPRRGRAAQEDLSRIWLRLEATVLALGEIGDPKAFGPLEELLGTLHEGPVSFHLFMPVVKALRTIDNPRAVDLLLCLLDDPTYPGRAWLSPMLAGMDLLNSVHSLTAGASVGDLGVLRQALQATWTTMERLQARREGHPEPPRGDGPSDPDGADLMRQLEWTLRELGRGRGEPGDPPGP